MSGHEHRDANVRNVAAFGIGLSVLLAGVLLVMAWLFFFLGRNQEFASSPPMATSREIPPQPRLQVTPVTDLKQMRAAEDSILNSYAWVDRQEGTVRIPIERAMELLAQRGLPARSGSPTGKHRKE